MTALPRKTASVVAVNVAPDKPPTRGEAAKGETHTSSHSFKNNLNTMHGQPLPSSFYFTKEMYRRYPHRFLRLLSYILNISKGTLFYTLSITNLNETRQRTYMICKVENPSFRFSTEIPVIIKAGKGDRRPKTIFLNGMKR
ncbi:MAG: hypothetical protein DRJ47_00160 [Thermoprotei archaeon]|nr:MAG: hypothetical protein DRJ47_00160 [Thermoprotei archaeon]